MKKLFVALTLFTLACGVLTTPAATPTYDPYLIDTAVAGTLSVALTQTALALPPTSTPTLTPTTTPTFVSTSTFTVTPSSTPLTLPVLGAYQPYTIEVLRARTYGGGELTPIKVDRETKNYAVYLAKYPSDGLNMHALVTVPKGGQKYGVVITIHGYARAEGYDLFQDSRFIDKAFIQSNYIIIHPDMRNYPPADNGDNHFRVGQSIDILNLLAIIKAQSGKPGLLENADPDRIGLEGASTGGGVALRVATVNHDVKAVVLYSSISGDERRNVPFFFRFTRDDPQFQGDTGAPDSSLAYISPASYYSSITAPVLLAHGTRDAVVPLEWAQETCALLRTAAVNVTCNYYDGAGHSFYGKDLDLFFSRAIKFFQTHLR